MSKTKYIQFRATEEEKNAIQKLADQAGMSVTELLKTAASRVRPWTAADKIIEQEKVRQLARIGNNLNQIAKWCNIHKDGAEAIQILQQLMEIEREVKRCISNT